MLIYKILRQPEWLDLARDGVTAGAPVDRADGYVHFSTRAQVEETAAKHFAGQDDLMLLALNDAALGDALKWEASRGGALFPHLYAHLQIKDVVWFKPIALQNGVHVFPPEAL